MPETYCAMRNRLWTRGPRGAHDGNTSQLPTHLFEGTHHACFRHRRQRLHRLRRGPRTARRRTHGHRTGPLGRVRRGADRGRGGRAPGSLDDLDSLRAGAEAADGVCHLAFIHDFSDFAANCATDLRAIETIGEALAGTDKPFVVTSGTPGLPGGKVATEEDHVDPESFAAVRQPSELAAVALAERGCGRRLCGCLGPCTVRGSGLRPSTHRHRTGEGSVGVRR